MRWAGLERKKQKNENLFKMMNHLFYPIISHESILSCLIINGLLCFSVYFPSMRIFTTLSRYHPLYGAAPRCFPVGSVLSTPFSLCTNSVAHPQPIVPSPRIPVCLPSRNSWDCLRITTATVDLYFSILLNIAWYRVAQLINLSHWSSFSTSRTFCIFLH